MPRAASIVSRYGFAAAIMSVTAAVNHWARPILGRESPFILFTFAITVVGYYVGFGPGALAHCVGTTLAAIQLAGQSIHPSLYDEVLPVSVYLPLGLAIVGFVTSRRAALVDLSAANAQLQELLGREQASSSQLRQLADRVAASEARYRTIAQVTDDTLWEWDVTNDSLQWTEGIVRVFGYKPEDVGSTLTWAQSCIHPDDRDRVVQNLKQALASTASEWNEQFLFRRASGEYANVVDRARITRDAAGQAMRMVGSMLDVTELKRAERALQDSQRFLRRLIRDLPTPVVVLDLKARVLIFNKACERLTGLKRRDVIGRPLVDTLVATDDAQAFNRRFAEPYAPEVQQPHEARWRTAWGDERRLMWRFTLVLGNHSEPPYLLGAGTVLDGATPMAAAER